MRLCYVLPVLMLLATPAYAIDFSQPVIGDDGKPMCQEAVKDGEPCAPDRIATLGRVVKIALYASFPDEQSLSGEDKYKRAEIAQAITGASDVKLKQSDRELVKKLVGKLYGPLVVYAVWNMLEQ